MNYQIKDEERFYSDMGFRLKQMRQVKQVLQEALAETLGVVKQTIQKYESGEVKISPEIIQQCAQIFEISVGYFYIGEETQETESDHLSQTKRVTHVIHHC